MASGGVIGEAFVKISPSLSNFAGETRSGVKEGMRGAEEGVHESVGRMKESFKGLAEAAGLAFGAEKAIDFVKGSIEAAERQEKVAKQTEAVLKSTGDASGATAEGIDKLTMSLSNQTGISHTVIEQGSNMLLTFTNLKNGVGAGNDVFNQANKTLVDMTAALGTDPQKQAIQLGKALNDPIKGISALARVGVTFDDQQKKTIKTMVEAGNTMGAQKMILGELNKEFGGSAAAQATPLDKLKNMWANLREELGTKLLPIVDKVAEWLQENIPKAIAAVQRAWQQMQPQIEQGEAFFRTKLLPVFMQIEGFISANLKPILIGLGVAIALLTAPVTTVVAALILAYTHFQSVRTVVADLVTFFETKVMPVIMAVADYVNVQFGHLEAFVRSHMAAVQEAIGHIMVAIQDVVSAALTVIMGAWNLFGGNVIRFITNTFNTIKSLVEDAIRAVRDVIDIVLDLINGDWGKAWKAVKDLLATIWDAIKTIIRGALDNVENLLHAAWTAISAALTAAWNAIKGKLEDALSAIVGFFAALPGKILHAIASLGGDLVSWAVAAFEKLGNEELKGIAATVKFFTELPGKILTTVEHFGGDIVNWAEGAFTKLGAAEGRGIAATVKFFTDLPGKILSALSGFGSLLITSGEDLIKGLAKGIENAAGSIGSAIEGVIKGAVGKIPGASTVLHAFGFAAGGVVHRPTLAVIGEGGEDEYVVPKSKLAGFMASMSESLPQASIPAQGKAGSGGYSGPLIGEYHAHTEVDNDSLLQKLDFLTRGLV